MIDDARGVQTASVIDTDLCVIGCGAAGIALAMMLLPTAPSVTLIESGGETDDEACQHLNRGKVCSNFLADSSYLVSSRLRQLGGATNHWAGICGPLSAIDLVPRPGVPNSGWPFDLAHLAPFYQRALSLVDVPPFDAADEARSRRPWTFPRQTGIVTIIKHFSPFPNFRLRYRRALSAAGNLRVLLHGTVTALTSDAQRRAVVGARVKTVAGNHFTVRARQYVLAAGGLENPRLLLASGGLGNAHDVVGRYFMEHVYQLEDPGRALLAIPPAALALYEGPGFDRGVGVTTMGRFALAEEILQEHALPNHGVALRRMRRRSSPAPPLDYAAALGLDLELVPDPANRVSLREDTDAFGVPTLRLAWSLTSYDKEHAIRYLSIFARQLASCRVGRAEVRLAADYDWSRFISSSHHMGTTRMHRNPRHGVVNADCRVHGLSNLHVAGSSVFPTGGQMNPTLTIVALAIRLADHLRVSQALSQDMLPRELLHQSDTVI